MLEQKYDRPFAVGLVGASGTLGILIPPSLAFIVYAIIAEQSVPRLFLAGVVPGLMQAAMFVGYSIWVFRNGQWVLEENHCEPGYESGAPPDCAGSFEGDRIKQEGVPIKK